MYGLPWFISGVRFQDPSPSVLDEIREVETQYLFNYLPIF